MNIGITIGTVMGVTVGLVVANFAYQAFHDQAWDSAVERSWFQVTAIIVLILAQKTSAWMAGP